MRLIIVSGLTSVRFRLRSKFITLEKLRKRFMTNEPKTGGESRRTFLQKTATAAAAVAATNMFKTPVYGQNQAPSTGRVIGANDRITGGFIGVGGQGFNAHVRQMKEHAASHNVAQVAVCDVSKHRADEVKQFIGGD